MAKLMSETLIYTAKVEHFRVLVFHGDSNGTDPPTLNIGFFFCKIPVNHVNHQQQTERNI